MQQVQASQSGGAKIIKQISSNKNVEAATNAKVNSPVKAKQNDFTKMPPIPTCGVYSRVQKARRHVRKNIESDYIFEQENAILSSPAVIQNASESLVPMIPVQLFTKKK